MVAGLFDTDSDGRGEIWLGAQGWASTNSLSALFAQDSYVHWSGEVYSETIFSKYAQKRAEAGDPLLFYGYEPSLLVAALHPRQLDVGPPKSGVACSAPANTLPCLAGEVHVYIAMRDRLNDSHPRAAKLMSTITLTTDDIGQMAKIVEDRGVSAAEAADIWISTHQEAVDSWKRAATAAAD